MSLIDTALPYVRGIAAYQPGKPISELARELGMEEARIVKLASNENPLGVPDSARRAIEQCIAGLALYPDGNGYDLKFALAEKLGCAMDQIVLGNGSNDVLDIVARVFLAPGTSAVMAQHCFAVYPLSTQIQGAQVIEVPARDFGHDLHAMRAAIRADTRVVFVANPNNPTGTWLEPQQVRQFIASVPRHVAVVLDEAYGEFLELAQRADAAAWTREFEHLIVTRTFAKAFGLAGLRVGYSLANAAVADLMNRVRHPFNVNSLALAAARAALTDDAFLARSKANNDAGRKQLQEGFAARGLAFVPSHGNFVLVKVGDAKRVFDALLKQGVIVRPVASYGLPQWLRVSIGLPEHNAIFLKALDVALDQVREAA